MPQLKELYLGLNPMLGTRGTAALFAVLKKRPALIFLDVGPCGIDDEGVASLLDSLGKDDFKALKNLYLDGNKLTG